MKKNEFFNKKEARSFDRLVGQLFGKKTIYRFNKIEEKNRNWSVLDTITIAGGNVYLSKTGSKTLVSLTSLFIEHQMYSENLCFKDVYKVIKSNFQAKIEGEANRPHCSFFNDVITELDSLIDEVTFLAEVEGVVFDGFDYLKFDGAEIRKFDESLLPFKSDDNLLRKRVVENLEGKLVYIATERGSTSVAADKYRHRAKLDLSILKVLTCFNLKGGFSSTHISLKSKESFQYQHSSLIGHTSRGSFFTSESASPRRDLPLTIERLQEFNEENLFGKLTQLTNRTSKNELEQAIEKSLYWFSEAQSDGCLASSFLKLWSCLECLFTIAPEQITERNARGIAALFSYGDLDMRLNDVEELKNYGSLKKTIKNFYELRSALAHRAEYKKIDKYVTVLLSYIVCSTIISATCLVYRGYESLQRLADESDRLDKLSQSRTE